MALEFDKVVLQVADMGEALANRSMTVEEQTTAAGDLLMKLNDLDAIRKQILLTREKDAGFRGAMPTDEPINVAIPLPECPAEATILAADGSQVYPDPHGAALYWLANIGVFIYPHGSDDLPQCISEPSLYYSDKDVRGPEGRVIPNAAINARRAVYEMQMLAREARRCADEMTSPLVALYDGPLLGFFTGKEVSNPQQLVFDYHEAMELMNEAGAALIGYVDRPNSSFVVSTIYLMTLEPAQIIRTKLQTAGQFEGLSDRDLYQWLLGPGERSGMMIQQSPQNKEYKEMYSDDHEIVFFYLNCASAVQEPYLARIEVPMWVARHKELINAIHALLYHQCQITDRYPYALTRADEIAVIHAHEKRALDEMIAVELLRNQQSAQTSQKFSSKAVARYGRQQHRGL